MKRLDWFLLFLILLSFFIGFYFYPILPDQIPMHWNIQGEVDNYAGKLFGIIFMPGLNLALFVLFILLPYIDPRKENYQKFSRVYTIFRWTMHLFFMILYLLTLVYALNEGKELPSYLSIPFLVPLFVSVLFIIIGNYLGKIKDNFFIGIRTPWTLSSKEVWYKTHRLAGRLFVLSGFLGVIGSFFPGMISFIMLMGPIMISTIYILIYSYLEYRKEQKN